MKQIVNYIIFLAIMISAFACNDLDLASLDKANSESWYAKKDHFRYSLNGLYRTAFFKKDNDLYSDDMQKRTDGNPVKDGTIDSEWGDAATFWAHLYKGISRSNTIIAELTTKGDFLSESDFNQFMGEAKFVNAYCYGSLIARFGDVPYFEENITIDESFSVARTDKNTVKEKVYAMFDEAAQKLPETNTGTIYATKGAAYAYKARIALYLGDYEVAKNAAKACMDLGVYELHDSFEELFFSKTKVSPELILTFPRSNDLNVKMHSRPFIPRNHGGWGQYHPSWQLMASFYCTDGLPIDESPLFDPKNPFLNRDPRLAATIVPFGKLAADDDRDPSSGFDFYGIEYNPHPNARQVMKYSTGAMIKNNDTRSIAAYAAFNGLMLNKSVDAEWFDDAANESKIIDCRYAEVLLTYAEAKIELNDIDASVLAALNSVRERAYNGSGITYPEITTTNQAELRLIVRNERRVELAWEGSRYMDLIRWRLAEKALVGKNYGLAKVNQQPDLTLPVTGNLMDNVVNVDKWFWGMVPEIDADGLPNFQALEDAGLCTVLSTMNFDKNKQYLFPIPNSNIKLNESLTQNPGY